MSISIHVKSGYDPQLKRFRLTINDEGQGITKEKLYKIMDPNFTTKRKSCGTEMGPSVSSNIIKEQQEILEFTFTVGRDTNDTYSFILAYW